MVIQNVPLVESVKVTLSSRVDCNFLFLIEVSKKGDSSKLPWLPISLANKIENETEYICSDAGIIVVIVRAPLSDFSLAQNGTSAQTNSHEDVCNMEIQSNDQISSSIVMEDISISSENVVSDIVPETTLSPASKFCKVPKAGEKASQEALKLWKENGFSSLIMAAPEIDPWNLVKDLLPLLSYSAPFAIYHQYLQPLVTCMHNLQIGKMANFRTLAA
ncbi:hypothetical protein Q3G72_016672 [Acer saccharum]|nr:hypothetical protein Q3G72_016672 [Acer saccharum]